MRNGLPYPLVLVLVTALCAPAVRVAHAAAPTVNGGNYVELASVLTSDADYEAWYGFRSALRQNFDDICGDTFCEGDYSNIEPLRFQCSVNRITGRIGQCSWTFAASDETIDARSGRIGSRGMQWQCITPLTAGTTVEQLLAAMQGGRPLYAPLPGSSRTIYDGLIDCL